MKLFSPVYYKRFACIADRCRHSCCVGWEIDIDDDTMQTYAAMNEGYGRTIRQSIDTTETPHFRLEKSERCPHLNERGLCNVILSCGEQYLCDICREHPRFYNDSPLGREVGLGMACEEACRLILNENDPVSLTVLEDDGEEDLPLEEESDFYAVRDHILSILQNRALTYDERAAGLDAFCGLHSDTRTPSQWAEIYRSLERLDHAWDACLDRLEACQTWAGGDERDTVWEQLAVYFILRYAGASLDDGLLAPRVAYALHAVSVIRTLGQGMDLEALCELCRMYSCEIEYSEENIETLMERMTV